MYIRVPQARRDFRKNRHNRNSSPTGNKQTNIIIIVINLTPSKLLAMQSNTSTPNLDTIRHRIPRDPHQLHRPTRRNRNQIPLLGSPDDVLHDGADIGPPAQRLHVDERALVDLAFEDHGVAVFGVVGPWDAQGACGGFGGPGDGGGVPNFLEGAEIDFCEVARADAGLLLGGGGCGQGVVRGGTGGSAFQVGDVDIIVVDVEGVSDVSLCSGFDCYWLRCNDGVCLGGDVDTDIHVG